MAWYLVGPEGQTPPELDLGEYTIHKVKVRRGTTEVKLVLRSSNLEDVFVVGKHHSSTSANHLRMIVEEKSLILEDLNSTHGSFLNDTKVDKPTRLTSAGKYKLKLPNAEFSLIHDGKMKLNLGFLASGNGSNIEAILRNIDEQKINATPKVVISNNPNAEVLALAWDKKIPQYCVNTKNYKKYGNFANVDQVISTIFSKHNVNLVVAAGYMKYIGEEIVKPYKNRILNIHPSLLPKHAGKGMYGRHVHQAVINSEDRQSGATVHLVNKEYDRGRGLMQFAVPRYKQDSVESLANRVLSVEHALYSQVLREIQEGMIKLNS